MGNYFDIFSEKWGAYSEYLSRRHINSTGPTLKFYILDRSNGPSDDIYNEEVNRVYLPYFSIRGTYLVQQWSNVLGENAINQNEENTTDIVLNLQDMVETLRALKDTHSSDMNITYDGGNKAGIGKDDGVLTLKDDCDVVAQFIVSDYSVGNLCDAISAVNNFTAVCTGDTTDGAENLVDFDMTETIPHESINIYTVSEVYSGITEMIEIGDMFITHHKVLYEVVDAFVANLSMTQWPTYIVKGEKRTLSDGVKLPNNGIDEILNDNYLLGQYKNENFFSH